ncbi:MAG: hypothetical protein KJ879_02945 [Nanoarchaeota archaeon]|nr:hypothetical protein [Nanoarchaeota archaeon]
METQNLPKNINELKSFILEILGEANDRIVPYVSVDEQEELEKLYGDSLYEEHGLKDSARL